MARPIRGLHAADYIGRRHVPRRCPKIPALTAVIARTQLYTSAATLPSQQRNDDAADRH